MDFSSTSFPGTSFASRGDGRWWWTWAWHTRACALRSCCCSPRNWGCCRCQGHVQGDKRGRTCTGACRFAPLSHETCGCMGFSDFALLHEIAERATSRGAALNQNFMENVMRVLSTMPCRSISRQVLASAPFSWAACLDGRPVPPRQPIPTGGLALSFGRPRRRGAALARWHRSPPLPYVPD